MKINNQDSSTKVYFVGSGLASLAGAVYLVKDAALPGQNIHILEQGARLGGSLDGEGEKSAGFVVRGGRMHEEKYVCYWDLLSHIPSATDPSKSVTEESFEFNEKYVANARSRLLKEARVLDVSSFGLSPQDRRDIISLTVVPEVKLGNKRIQDWFARSFFTTPFWKMWESMFAFQEWSSLAEMRRYCVRFMHLLPGLEHLGGIYRTVYNQYDSVVAPMERWLKARGVHFDLNVQVEDVDFEIGDQKKTATAIHCVKDGVRETIALGEGEYVFITNGSIVDCSDTGSMTRPAVLKTKEGSGSWKLWERIAKRDTAFGNPGVFCDRIDLQKWESFTVTLRDPTFLRHMGQAYGYIPGVGGLVTITDSNWLLSFVIAAQPHFANQPADVEVFWGYGLYQDRVGNFVKKTMEQCTGEEILTELFAHLKITDKMKPVVAAGKVTCLPVMMPFIDSLFMPRSPGDRPQVVPDGATNFGFLGQFAEVPDDCVFTVEYSVRSAQMAVYHYFKTGKKVPPVYLGGHKARAMVKAVQALNR